MHQNRTGTCRSKPVMALIRSLYWLCVKYSFLISPSHIQGVTNTLADALSRGLLQSFKILAPTASPSATPRVLPQLPSLTELPLWLHWPSPHRHAGHTKRRSSVTSTSVFCIAFHLFQGLIQHLASTPPPYQILFSHHPSGPTWPLCVTCT